MRAITGAVIGSGSSWRNIALPSLGRVRVRPAPVSLHESDSHTAAGRRSATFNAGLLTHRVDTRYRSDDGGETWLDIGDGLSSDFGFPIVVDPRISDSAYIIPLDGAGGGPPRWQGGGLRDARRRRHLASAHRRLAQQDAYVTVLREAFDSAGQFIYGLELYFGATSGDIFGSSDAGASGCIRRRAPPAGAQG